MNAFCNVFKIDNLKVLLHKFDHLTKHQLGENMKFVTRKYTIVGFLAILRLFDSAPGTYSVLVLSKSGKFVVIFWYFVMCMVKMHTSLKRYERL